ncbi:MAG: Gfo/Idh/MocA family oxidoreductase [Hyphomicrobiales bacterium]|nr:Gfo/Idh/MocA family oxidoreductase [Hyphomicrobiales bacterium]
MATDNYKQILERDDIEVLDIATHPEVRTQLIEDALKAGKHVLSQKPFVTDLDIGERLVKMAKEKNRKLAVNQNGRWAPHFSYIRQAVNQGLIGDVMAAHLAVHWDHGWTADTAFNEIDHLILYDFAIHWFDMLCCIMGGREPKRVYATRARAPEQKAKPPLLAQVVVEYDKAQATLVFDGAVKYGPHDSTIVLGTKGGIRSSGPDLSTQQVVLHTDAGCASPELKGEWFVEGFHGAMAELLSAIEEDREPSNSADNNLQSLALCFAAVASAEEGVPKAPGKVRKTLP